MEEQVRLDRKDRSARRPLHPTVLPPSPVSIPHHPTRGAAGGPCRHVARHQHFTASLRAHGGHLHAAL